MAGLPGSPFVGEFRAVYASAGGELVEVNAGFRERGVDVVAESASNAASEVSASTSNASGKLWAQYASSVSRVPSAILAAPVSSCFGRQLPDATARMLHTPLPASTPGSKL